MSFVSCSKMPVIHVFGATLNSVPNNFLVSRLWATRFDDAVAFWCALFLRGKCLHHNRFGQKRQEPRKSTACESVSLPGNPGRTAALDAGCTRFSTLNTSSAFRDRWRRRGRRCVHKKTGSAHGIYSKRWQIALIYYPWSDHVRGVDRSIGAIGGVFAHLWRTMYSTTSSSYRPAQLAIGGLPNRLEPVRASTGARGRKMESHLHAASRSI